MCVWIDDGVAHFRIFWDKTVLRFAAYWFKNINLLLFWGGGGGRRSFIDPICFSFLHGFAHVSKPGYQRDT